MSRHRFLQPGAWIVVLVIAVASGAWFLSSRPAPLPPIRNVVLISIDTCRADHFGCYGHVAPTTPHLDAVAEEGVLFTRALSTNPITLPAHSSMLTGTYPPRHHVHDNNNYRLHDSNTTLAEILQKQNFQTAAFVGAFPLDSRFGLAQGFETYDDRFNGGSEDTPASERRAEEVSQQAIAWLDKRASEPFFLFLHYFDPHADYRPPEPYASRFATSPYQGEIAYTDYWIGQVIAKLKSQGIYDQTLLVVTSDHAEGLGEHGESTHSFFIYQGTIRVPLIIKAPGGAQGVKAHQAVSIVDVVPTVLGLLGIDDPPAVQGQDLSREVLGHGKPPDERLLYCESLTPVRYGCNSLRGLLRGNWKFIWTTRPELYDLERDPGEAKNLVEQHPDVAADLAKRLGEFVARQEQGDTADGSHMPDRESVQQLKSLGYVGGGKVQPSAELIPDGQDPKDAIAIFEGLMRGHELFSLGQLDEARAHCLEILQQQPTNPMNMGACIVLGEIAEKEGRYAEAVDHFSQYLAKADQATELFSQQDMLQLDFEISVAHSRLANILKRMGRLDEAIGHYERAQQRDPRSAEPHVNLGKALLAKGRLPEGIGHLRQALQIDAKLPDVHHNLGLALYRQGNPAEAVHHYQQALLMDPNRTSTHIKLGEILLAGGQLDAGILHLRKGLSADAKQPDVHYNLGLALARKGKLNEAVSHYRKSLSIDPDSTKALVNLGITLVSLGEIEEGIEYLRHALRTGDKLPQVHYNLGIALAKQGKVDEAITHYRAAIEIQPDYPNACYKLSVALSKQGRADQAREQLIQFGRRKPDHVTLINQWAWTMATRADATLRDPRTAVLLAEVCVELSNDQNPTMLDTLAAAYAAAGQYERAVSTAEKAISLATDAKNTALADAIRKRLALYKKTQPYYEATTAAGSR